MRRPLSLHGALGGAVLLGLLGACSSMKSSLWEAACQSDSDCGSGQVCFPDGCGDPGSNIAVEIQPSAASGQLAQDFEVKDVRPKLDFQAAKPSVLEGQISQMGDDGAMVAFAGEISVAATGESLVIPGRLRSAQANVLVEKGSFALPIPSGKYMVAVQPSSDPSVPLYGPDVVVEPGDAAQTQLVCPSEAMLQRIDGKLLLSVRDGLPVLSAAMDVQAFDADTQLPLSQKAAVSSGAPGSTGDFSLWLLAPALANRIHVRATPHDPAAFAPTKTFSVPLGPPPPPLELGGFGPPVTVRGVVNGTDQQPLADAVVYVSGVIKDGAQWKSPPVRTDAHGAFTLTTLPSGDVNFQLFIAPPASSSSGLLIEKRIIPEGGGDLGAFVTPDKIPVAGKLLRPDGEVAAGVPVEARAVEKLGDFPIPDGVLRGNTDDNGAFTLKLDPGVYRLDFLPTNGFPRASRIVPVGSESGGKQEAATTQELPTFSLSRGRRISGRISSIPDRTGNELVAAPYATVKFFRVTQVEDKPVAFLLAEGVADAAGTYSVLLPTRDE